MDAISIGEVARRSGLTQSSIRYYESEGLLDAPPRASGRRAFPPDTVDRLQVIRMARELGFSLGEIRVLLMGFSPETPPSARWQQLARKKLPEIDAVVERARAMKALFEKGLRCHCVSVQDCLLFNCNPPVTLGRRKPA